MRVSYEVPRISVSTASLADADVELIIIPIAQDHASAAAQRYEGDLGDDLRSALERGEFRAKANEVYVARAAAGWRAARVVFVGGGPRAEINAERVRRMAAAGAHAARRQKRARIGWADIEPGVMPAAARLEIAVEGIVLANFDNGVHKSRDKGSRFFISDVTVLTSEPAEQAVASGRAMGESVNAARVLVNEPGNYLTPRTLADKAASLAAVPGITCEILDEKQIEALKMGLLLGVARGSAEPPRILILKYAGNGASAQHTLGLVGKGITFDTGGLSLKPADGMERMKDDMAGGACVVAAMRSIAQQQLPIRAVAVVPMTENMPGGRAVKPGDILTGASGLTVEVNNTDAEGRLILGDGLWYARQLGATHLIDVATLTGAIVVGLGKITTGLFGTPQPWVDHIRQAADRAGEKIWQMPLFDDYREQLKSDIADLLNSPGRPAGSITAAMFLKEFAGNGPWAHLDIAGTAWAEEAKSWQPKGATGAMIRTLIEVARGGIAG